MKKIYLLYIIFLISPQIVVSQNVPEFGWLKKNIHSLNSIDPKDENFEDLEFLIPILKDKDIVMLGEEAHSFTHTFAAKSRLIKFLHQRLGFNILAFEINGFPLYEASLNTRKTSDKLSPIQKRLYPFWSQATTTQELFKYLENNKSLQVTGIDVQPYGWSPLHALDDLLNETSSEILDYKNFNQFKTLFKRYYNSPIDSLKISEYALLNMFLDDILYASNLKDNLTLEDKIIYKAIENFKNHLRNRIVDEATTFHMSGNLKPTDSLYGFLGDTRSMGAINRRDEQMAKNIQWLKEELYPNEKIIVWAASAHTMYDRHKIKRKFPKDFPFYTRFDYGYNWKNMGTYLQEMYGDRIYSVGFSPVSGTIDHSTKKNSNYLEQVKRGRNSIEEKLMKINGAYFYLDFSVSKTSLPKSIFNENTVSNILGSMEIQGDISEFFDGILFMKGVTPIKYVD